MEADYLILTDGAHVANDKLYMLGGGWIFVFADKFPATHPMTIAVGIVVDWNETNRQHEFRIDVRAEDEHRTAAEIKGAFEQGRPPGIPAGVSQRVQMAIPLNLPLEKPGVYAVRLLLNGHAVKTTTFTVLDRSASAFAPTKP